jgi:hypothetical protein
MGTVYGEERSHQPLSHKTRPFCSEGMNVDCTPSVWEASFACRNGSEPYMTRRNGSGPPGGPPCQGDGQQGERKFRMPSVKSHSLPEGIRPETLAGVINVPLPLGGSRVCNGITEEEGPRIAGEHPVTTRPKKWGVSLVLTRGIPSGVYPSGR